MTSEPTPLSLTLSASQVGTWNECQRKWAWKYVAKIPAPQHASAALGSRVHGHLERYLESGTPIQFTGADGRPDEAAEIAASGIHLLPPPKSGMVERKFDLDLKLGSFVGPRGTLPKVMVTGRKDFERIGDDGRPEVWDHKTTSAERWAKTPEDLLEDVQAGIYGWEALQKFGGASVSLRWVYYRTRGARKAWIVPAEMSREHADRLFDQFLVVSKDIATTLVSVDKDGPDGPLSLPPTPSACEGFGGCPYRGLCNLSPKQRMSSIMSQANAAPATSSLLASLTARRAAPSPVSEGITPDEAVARTYTPPTGPAAPAPATFGPINPPESKLVSETDVPAPDTTPPETPAVEKPKRTRAKRTTAPEEISAPGQSAPVEAKGFTLYVDAYPQGAPAKCIEDMIDAAKRKVCEAKGVGDYRYIEFGGGTGMVSEAFFAAFDAAIAEDDAPAGWVVHTHTHEASFLLAGLVARAALVVRGIR